MNRLTQSETEFIFDCLLEKRRRIIADILKMTEWPADQREQARHLIDFLQPLLRKLIPRQPRARNGYPTCANCFGSAVSPEKPVCANCGATFPEFTKWSIIASDGDDIGALSGYHQSRTAVTQEEG